MATARERIEEEVTCPVCMDPFSTTGERIPRILPCHHTICETCLVGISRAEDHAVTWTLKCPSCRNETVIPNGEITNFELDFRVNRLIEVLNRLQQLDLPAGEALRRKAAELRPEVTKSANSVRSYLRQVELAVRQNNVNSLIQKKKVADNIKLCMALLKQKEKEMIEEIESRRCENEQALILQQEEAGLELGNIESVLALEQDCFSHSETLVAARQAEAEVLPLLEVYSKRYLSVTDPVVPEILHAFPQELTLIRKALTQQRLGDARDISMLQGLQSVSGSDSSLDDSGIADSPPADRLHSDRVLLHDEEPSRYRGVFLTEGLQPTNHSTPLESRGLHPTNHNTPLESRGPPQAMSPVVRARSPSAHARRPLNNSVRHFSTTWATRGSGPGQLDTPTGLCIVTDTQIAVADAGNCRICVFNSDGSFLRLFGRKGRSRGQLNCPNAVTSRGERIFIADTYNHRISIHRVDGGFVNSFGTKGRGEGEFDRPIGITTTEGGEVIVADTWNHRLQVFDLEGNFIRQIGRRGTGPGEFQCPCSIALDSAGHIYVCDLDNKRVQIFDSDGNFIRHFGRPGSHPGAMHAPRAIAIDSNDYVYVTEYEKHFFQVFDSQDNFVSRYGSHGNGVGEFDKPCGVTVDSGGRVFISDSFNHRLHIF